jgi:hypothetical protein
MAKRSKPPNLKELLVVQLTLDLPQFLIKPGSRVVILDSNKTGRVSHICHGHAISFPGGGIKTISRHLLVEIE